MAIQDSPFDKFYLSSPTPLSPLTFSYKHDSQVSSLMMSSTTTNKSNYAPSNATTLYMLIHPGTPNTSTTLPSYRNSPLFLKAT